MDNTIKLSPRERLQIAIKADCCPQSVARVYAGERCTVYLRARIERAAVGEGLPLPPPAPVEAVG